MKILFLPIDSRPCTCDDPIILGELAGHEMIYPDIHILDDYKIPSDPNVLSIWLTNNADGCDYAVISAEQLAYGGLLSSRKMNCTIEEAKKHLDVIARVKERNKKIKIYLTSVIMRTTISTLKKEDQIWWKKISEYSAYSNELYSDKIKKQLLEKEIPANILNEYHSCRNRNHQINLYCEQLVSKGFVDQLYYLQEDTKKGGIQEQEQARLMQQSDILKIKEKVFLHNGTDEIAGALIGKITRESFRLTNKIHIEYFNPVDSNFIPAYEDHPYSKTIQDYIKSCGAEESSLTESDTVIAVYLPKDGIQNDLSINPEQVICRYTDQELVEFCSRIEKWLSMNKQVALLDVYAANGGESTLMKWLNEMGLLNKIHIYSGWNTASNSLGSLLGEVLCLPVLGEKARSQIFWRHVLDDYVYQGVVRRRIQKTLENRHQDIWNINNMEMANQIINKSMHATVDELNLSNQGMQFQVSLRWPRIFEVKISIKMGDDLNGI